ncbi:MAG: diacylglycerol kinase family protein [Firmicutes bacterium]|jgi:diacylglycerol kinase|nr:diacylglycerol kinase family protein [Bacillota bacterium]
MRATNLVESFRFAALGVAGALRAERNLRAHFAIAAIAVGTGAALGLSPVDLGLIVLASTVVISAELVNTAVEACVDLVTPEYHPLAMKAKNVAAGAVLISAIGSVIVGALTFGPRVIVIIARLVR